MNVSRRSLFGAALALATTRDALAEVRAAPSRDARVLYVSHGSPLMLPGNEARVEELRAWGRTLKKPSGIVVMTPHFAARAQMIGTTGAGFAMYDLPEGIKRRLPQDLTYATPTNAALTARVESLLGSLRREEGRRGFDHTTWMPLLAMFPAADVPVLEVGYPYVREADAFALGKKLAPLIDEGFMFFASGGMTHNLSAARDAATPAWASDFDAWATDAIVKRNVDDLVDWRHKSPATDLAHPDDGGHFRVLHVALGAALHSNRSASASRFPVAGFEGALSKRCAEIV